MRSLTGQVGSWAPSWLIGVRGGSLASGYSVTALALGLAFGRVTLLPVTEFLGVYPSIYVYNLGQARCTADADQAAGLLFAGIVWAVKCVEADIALVGFIGVAIAPGASGRRTHTDRRRLPDRHRVDGQALSTPPASRSGRRISHRLPDRGCRLAVHHRRDFRSMDRDCVHVRAATRPKQCTGASCRIRSLSLTRHTLTCTGRCSARSWR